MVAEEFEFDAMYENMSSSMTASTLEVAEECIREESDDKNDETMKEAYAGVEKFAEAIEVGE